MLAVQHAARPGAGSEENWSGSWSSRKQEQVLWSTEQECEPSGLFADVLGAFGFSGLDPECLNRAPDLARSQGKVVASYTSSRQ